MNVTDLWVIEYSFSNDAFGVRRLSDYLTISQKAFREGRICHWTILSVHPTEEACNEECSAWQEIRDKAPLSPETIQAEHLRVLLFQLGQRGYEIATGDQSCRPLGR